MLNRATSHKVHFRFIKQNNVNGIYGAWAGFNRVFFVSDPDAVGWLLSQREPQVRKIKRTGSNFAKTFGDHIVSASGEEWRRQRHVYNPVFNTTAYQRYYGAFVESVDKCVSKISQHVKDSSGADFNFCPVLSQFTIDLLGKSVFGYDFKAMDGRIDKYYEAYKHLFTLTPSRILYFMMPWLDRVSFLPQTRKLLNSIDKLDELFKHMLKNHQEVAPDGSKDIMYEMLAALKSSEDNVHLSERELMANMFVLFVAGHETTSTALSWVIYELAKNPQIQQRVYQEIQEKLGNNTPAFEDLNKLELVDNVLSESLRLHPPVTLLTTRETQIDLKYKDHFIPKGSHLGLNIYAVHHDSNYWEDPFTFNPDRFSRENSKGRHKFCYLPFSLGPRMCIGSTFSLIEQRLYLTRLVQSWEICLPKNHVLSDKYGISIGNPEAVWVSLKPRN